jgi:hypothetical protein
MIAITSPTSCVWFAWLGVASEQVSELFDLAKVQARRFDHHLVLPEPTQEVVVTVVRSLAFMDVSMLQQIT